MIYVILYGVLVFVAFLIALNGLLKGANKAQADMVLRFILIGTVITTFFVASWKHGVIAIGVALISARLTRPIAARAASKLLTVRKGENDKYIGLPPRKLEKISKRLDIGWPIQPNQFDKVYESYDQAESALFAYCESRPRIREVMNEFKISREDLKEIYFQLVDAGCGQWSCGHWVAASALAYPESLRYILSRKGEDISETCFNLIMYFEHGSFGMGL